MVICLEPDADFHMAQLMPLSLSVFCSSKIQIGFAFLVLAHPGSPGQRAVKCVFTNKQTLLVCLQTHKLCLHLCLLREFVQNRDFPVYELTY